MAQTQPSTSRNMYTIFDEANESWTVYKDRLSRFAKLQGYTNDEQADMLIAHFGPKSYRKLQLHVYPTAMKDLTVRDIELAMDEIYAEVLPNKFLERSKF